MTLVIAWLDNKANPTQMNVASDSLLTDGTSKWQYATKIFRVHPTHSYVAYCGGSNLGLIAVTQGIELLNNSSILKKYGTKDAPSINAKSDIFEKHLYATLKEFPEVWNNEIELMYCGYDDVREKRFIIKYITMSPKKCVSMDVDLYSDDYYVMGSGSGSARKKIKLLNAKGVKNCNICFTALKCTILSSTVKTVGGVPQMVVIDKCDSRWVGFNWDIKGKMRSTLAGIPLTFKSDMAHVEFRDLDFKKSKYLHSGRLKKLSESQ